MGVIPVQTNDVVFSVHATVFAVLTAIQCIIYEVSKTLFNHRFLIVNYYVLTERRSKSFSVHMGVYRCIFRLYLLQHCSSSYKQHYLSFSALLLLLRKVASHSDQIRASGIDYIFTGPMRRY